MPTAVERLGLRAGHGARQAVRLGWYLGHAAAMARLRRRVEADDGVARDDRPTRLPAEGRLLNAIGNLFARDIANIENGIYPAPVNEDAKLSDLIARSRAFFDDLPDIHRRRVEERHQEVFESDWRGRRPRYYLQNFHYQSDGYLSDKSARLYDIQVEVLFNGTANMMRRQLLVPMADFIRGKDPRSLSMTDVACGTGRFLGFVKQAYPLMPVLGVDLSDSYLAEARRHLGSRSRMRFAVANAEHLPLPDGSQDIVTSIFLFHELPPKVRRIVAREFARVLKPGGLLVFADSIQRGDVEDFDGLLEAFPIGFHEPYYESYTREDLDGVFGEAGFEPLRTDLAFLTKVAAYTRI